MNFPNRDISLQTRRCPDGLSVERRSSVYSFDRVGAVSASACWVSQIYEWTRVYIVWITRALKRGEGCALFDQCKRIRPSNLPSVNRHMSPFPLRSFLARILIAVCGHPVQQRLRGSCGLRLLSKSSICSFIGFVRIQYRCCLSPMPICKSVWLFGCLLLRCFSGSPLRFKCVLLIVVRLKLSHKFCIYLLDVVCWPSSLLSFLLSFFAFKTRLAFWFCSIFCFFCLAHPRLYALHSLIALRMRKLNVVSLRM